VEYPPRARKTQFNNISLAGSCEVGGNACAEVGAAADDMTRSDDKYLILCIPYEESGTDRLERASGL
jgi:hypothetical protein